MQLEEGYCPGWGMFGSGPGAGNGNAVYSVFFPGVLVDWRAMDFGGCGNVETPCTGS